VVVCCLIYWIVAALRPAKPILLRPEDEAENLFAQMARTLREQPGYHSWRGRDVLAALDHEKEKKRGA